MNAYDEKVNKIGFDANFAIAFHSASSGEIRKYIDNCIKMIFSDTEKIDDILEEHIKAAEAAAIKDSEPSHVSTYQKISNTVVKIGKNVKNVIAKHPFIVISAVSSAVYVTSFLRGEKTGYKKGYNLGEKEGAADGYIRGTEDAVKNAFDSYFKYHSIDT